VARGGSARRFFSLERRGGRLDLGGVLFCGWEPDEKEVID